MSSHTSNSKCFYFLLSLIFLLPIPLGSNRPWAWAAFELAIFVLTFFVILKHYAYFSLTIKQHKLICYLWLALIGFSILQIIPLPAPLLSVLSPTAYELYNGVNSQRFSISIDPSQSQIHLIKLMSFFCLFICVIVLTNSEKKINAILLTLVASGTFQALYGTSEVLLDIEKSLVFHLDVRNHATGTLVYKNHFANLLIMCLSAGLGLLVASLQNTTQSQPRHLAHVASDLLLSKKAIVRICLAILVIGLVMSRSRMGNTAFFASMTIVGLLSLVLIKNRSKGMLILFSSLIIIDLMIVSAYFGLEKVKQRLAETSFEGGTRDEVVLDSIPIVSEFPIFGSGAGSFYSTFPSYQTKEIFIFYDHLHNDYLQFLIEFGFLGAFLLVLVVAFSFYQAFVSMKNSQRSILRGLSFACLMAILGMGMHMTVDFPLQSYGNACYFVIILALSNICNKVKLENGKIIFEKKT